MEIMNVLIYPLIVGVILFLLNKYWGSTPGPKQNNEKPSEDNQDLKNFILSEVESNEELLDKGYHTDKYGNRTYRHRLFRNAFDNVKFNERFSSFSPTIIKTVSFYYGRIDKWNELVTEQEGEEISLKLQKIFNIQSALETTLRKTAKDLKKMCAP